MADSRQHGRTIISQRSDGYVTVQTGGLFNAFPAGDDLAAAEQIVALHSMVADAWRQIAVQADLVRDMLDHSHR